MTVCHRLHIYIFIYARMSKATYTSPQTLPTKTSSLETHISWYTALESGIRMMIFHSPRRWIEEALGEMPLAKDRDHIL